MITKYDTNCDTAYGRQKQKGWGLADGERIKRQYCEDGWNKTRWDVLSEVKKDDGRTQFVVAAPGFVTMVTLTEKQQKSHIKKIVTTHREYTLEEYKYCRCDEGWNGFLRGKKYVCGTAYIDQLGF
jgi:hypothetical protein